MDQSFTPIYLILVMSIFASLNTQGLRCPDRRKTVFSFFQRNRLDIILLQETHWSVEMEMQIKSEWDGDIIFNHGTNTARGVAILIHSRLGCSVMQTRSDNTLLADPIFTDEITTFWNNWLTEKQTHNLLHWWDKAKTNFKQIAIQQSSKLRKLK